MYLQFAFALSTDLAVVSMVLFAKAQWKRITSSLNVQEIPLPFAQQETINEKFWPQDS